MNELKINSDRIVQTYLSSLDSLSDKHKRHFLYRASLSSPENIKVNSLFNKIGREITLNENEFFLKHFKSNYDFVVKTFQDRLIDTTSIKRNDESKYKISLKYIHIYAFSELLLTLFYMKIFDINFDIEDYIEIDSIETILDNLLKSTEYILHSSSSSSNIVYYTKNLGLQDIETAYIKRFKDAFNGINTSSPDFDNYIYGLTHIIIGESNYYRKRIDAEKFKWVFEIFDNFQDDIKHNLSLDINTEVALSYLLGGIQNKYIDSIKDKLMQNFSSSQGFIQGNDTNSIKSNEHTNAIALVLFNFNKLNL